MPISASQVKELRERTGVGMMECKSALEQAGGSLVEAEKILRKKGLAAAQRKASRATTEGSVGAYIHAGGKIGVLVEMNCETDFVARTPQFQQLLKDISMHIAAANPRFVSREEVTSDLIEAEREIYREQAAASGKPPQVVEKIVDGKLAKFYEEFCLLEQPFIKDPEITIGELVSQHVARIGENIRIRRFVRFRLGDDRFVARILEPSTARFELALPPAPSSYRIADTRPLHGRPLAGRGLVSELPRRDDDDDRGRAAGALIRRLEIAWPKDARRLSVLLLPDCDDDDQTLPTTPLADWLAHDSFRPADHTPSPYQIAGILAPGGSLQVEQPGPNV